MGSLHVSLDLIQFVVPSEEVDEFGQDRVVVGLLGEYLFELLDRLLILVGLQHYLCQHKTGLVVLGVDLQQDLAVPLCPLGVSRLQVDGTDQLQGFLVLRPALQTLAQGVQGLLVAFLVHVVVVGELEEIVRQELLLLSDVLTFALSLVEGDLLVVEAFLQRILGVLVGGAIKGPLLLDVELIEGIEPLHTQFHTIKSLFVLVLLVCKSLGVQV